MILSALLPQHLHAATNVWTRLGAAGEHTTALAVAAPGVVYAGTSAGAILRIEDRTQTRLVQNLDGFANPVTAIAADPQNPITIYASTSAGLFKTNDSGITWHRLDADGGCVALSIDTVNTRLIYAATPTGVFRTADAGATWIRSPLAASTHNVVIDPQNTAIVYAATDAGVAKSFDHGLNWTIPPSSLGSVRGLAIDPMVPTILYAGALDGGVFKSVNGGLSWMESGLSANPVFALVVDIQDGSTVYAASEAGPFKSVDGGDTWSPITQRLNAGVTAMVGDLASCKIYIAATDGVFQTDIGPVLTVHSRFCVGAEWSLVVSHGGGNSTIRLLGDSNGSAWEIPMFGITDNSGRFAVTGAFPAETQGHHQLLVEVGGVFSNLPSFTVKMCAPK